MSEELSEFNTKTRVDSIDEHVSKKLKQRRIFLGITQHEVANALGLSVQQIQKYENADNRLSSSKLFQIAKSFNVPLDYFFAGLETEQNSTFQEEQHNFLYDNNITEKEVLALLNSFKKIEDNSVRNHIVQLVKSLAEAKK